MRGSQYLILVLAAALLVSAGVIAHAQNGGNDVITYSTNFIDFLRATIGDMSQELDQARKSHDSKKSDCIASRLVDLKRILAESDVDYRSLREAAFEKKPAKIREEFTKIRKSQNVAEQLVKLVNACYGRIGEAGGFTETVEQFLGNDLEGLPPIFGAYQRVDMPEPRPPQYEPEPVSISVEE
jgi:hypothetical protein